MDGPGAVTAQVKIKEPENAATIEKSSRRKRRRRWKIRSGDTASGRGETSAPPPPEKPEGERRLYKRGRARYFLIRSRALVE